MVLNTATAAKIPPTADGRMPGLGHLGALARNPLAFMSSLRPVADVVTIYLGTRPVYVVNTLDLVRTLLVEEASSCTRGIVHDKVVPVFGNGLLTAEGSLHRQQRRLLQPAFQPQQIAQFAGSMAQAATAQSRSWTPGKAFSATSEMHAAVVKMMSRALFRTDLADAVSDTLERVDLDVTRGCMWRTLYPAAWLEKLPIPVNLRFNRASAEMKSMVADVIAAYRSTGGADGGVLDILLSASDADTGHQMSDDQLRDEVITLLIAGSETAAVTLAWMFHELAENPDVDERMAAELGETMADRPISYPDLQRLTYANRVLNETLRLHTPTWILMRHAEQPLNLGGFQVPAGGEVLFSLTAMHRDPDIYPDPLRFDPDRWEPERSALLPPNAFMPFGAGKRQCIGNSFAWTEMLIMAATVLRDWRLVHAPGKRVREQPLATVRPKGLQLIPLPRSSGR